MNRLVRVRLVVLTAATLGCGFDLSGTHFSDLPSERCQTVGATRCSSPYQGLYEVCQTGNNEFPAWTWLNCDGALQCPAGSNSVCTSGYCHCRT